MKNKLSKIIAFTLAFAMFFTANILVSCGKEDEQPVDDGKWHLSDEPGRPSTPDGLLEDMDLGGYEANILFRKDDTTRLYECEGSIETGENYNAVYQTVYERNKTVEWRLNCTLNWIPTDSGALADTKNQMARVMQSQEYYDFINTTNNTSVQLGLNAYLCDLGDTAYIDLNQPWWWDDVNKSLSADNYRYHFISGDMHVSNFLKMSAFYFNTELIETYLKKDKEYFYDLVDQKQWTLEALYTMTRTLYVDTTVNPEMSNQRDQGDIFGFPWVGSESLNQFILSTRVAKNTYSREYMGTVTLNLLGNEDVIKVVDVMRKLLHESEGTWNRKEGFGNYIIEEFAEGNYVFLPQRLGAVQTTWMRDMRTNYGILPYPTLEAGDEYISDIQTSSGSICVQAIVELEDNLDSVSAIIEALCAEAYRYTTVAFYELALKAKYARDDDASRMIDIIYESAHKNFIVEYGTYAGSIMSVLATSAANNADVTSKLTAQCESAQKNINSFVTKVAKSD